MVTTEQRAVTALCYALTLGQGPVTFLCLGMLAQEHVINMTHLIHF